jgi:hypothetical protein
MTAADTLDGDLPRLAGEGIAIAIDPRTGAIARLESTETGWRVQDRPALGAGFRLLIPLPGRRNNQVRFATTIDNRSDRVVENVWAPCLGDLRPPSADDELRNFCHSYGSAAQLRMWPEFENICGYWGVDHPTQMASQDAISTGVTPVSPFMLVLARDQGMYAGVAERRDDLVSWHSELVPGYADSVLGTPDPDATIRFSTVHLPFIPPGAAKTLTPVVIELFRGDWHAGADIYRALRDTWLSPSPPVSSGTAVPAWADEPHSWLQLHVNSPEDELRIPFRDLPEIGRECAAAGVRAIQLVGWAEGGQDHGNPSHTPDPRLGTFTELRDAIAEIHALGVRVVLFCKFTWADRSTGRYPSLAADTIKDPYGDPYNGASYRYQTPTQLLGVNVPHLIPMCFGSERYLETCAGEFDKIVRLGAAGMLFDESQHHADALLCFDPGHGHPVPWPVYAGDNELARRFRARTRHDPGFLYCGEGLYDAEFEQYHLSYFRSATPGHVPLGRYLRPHAPLMTAATGFDDRDIVNQCLLYRYVLSYEPYNFKGRLPAFTRTVGYGRRMDALRTELRDWFWDGTFRDTVGAAVRTADGQPHHPYAVYLHRDTGDAAVAVANYAEEPVSVLVSGIGGASGLPGGAGSALRYRLVDDERWRETSGLVDLPARSAAVVIPAGGRG